MNLVPYENMLNSSFSHLQKLITLTSFFRACLASSAPSIADISLLVQTYETKDNSRYYLMSFSFFFLF